MRSIRIAGLLLLVAWCVGCKDARVAGLEQRIGGLEQRLSAEEQRANALEQRMKVMEATPSSSNLSQSMKQVNLESCISQANATFEKGIITNGTKTSNGSYTAPTQTEAGLEKQKQAKIGECKTLYSK